MTIKDNTRYEGHTSDTGLIRHRNITSHNNKCEEIRIERIRDHYMQLTTKTQGRTQNKTYTITPAKYQKVMNWHKLESNENTVPTMTVPYT